MARIKTGDIFKIKTSKGKTYLHFVFKDEANGDLVRVMTDLFSDQPDNLDSLACKDGRFLIFFPLSAAYKKKIVKKVGHYKSDFTRPEFMRIEHFVRCDFLGWHIVNSDTWKKELVNKLNGGLNQLSPWGIWIDTLLTERLEEGWALDSWC